MPPLFPTPDILHAEEDRRTVSVVAAAVARVRFGPKQAMFAVVAFDDNRPIGFRFVIPKHRRIVRDFLRHGHLQEVPDSGYVDVTDGMFMVQFHGTIIGQDHVPDVIPPGMPTELHVVDVIEVSETQIRGPMPEA